MNWLDAYLGFCSFVLGTVIGSFLNVVIYRLPEGLSLVSPGSCCPNCESPIRWYHNVPVVAWFLLRGRCKDCGQPISRRYPAVEVLTGLLFLGAYLVYGATLNTLIIMAFFAALVAITFIDIDCFRIPDKIVLPGTLIALAASIALTPGRWWEYLVAALGGSLFLLLLGLLWSGGMGMGDVKMALMMGAMLGASTIVALFVAFLVGGVGGALLILLGVKSRKDRIPFGPYLALGSVVAGLFGHQILDLYMSSIA
ncbi:MAG TPA: prepilin peptidase [Thermoleophilia bacterium]|nr:prepilin peptidase [Thermoleophilia bacterium]